MDLGCGDVQDSIAWTNWHRIGRVLEALDDGESGEKRLIEQLMLVLERRGVRHVFEGIQEEDYWVVAAAQRIAAERVFPTIAVFAREVLDGLGEHGIVRATPENRIATMRSESLQNPDKWGVSCLFLALTYESWAHPKKWSDRHLFVQLALNEPTLSVGYRVEIKGQRAIDAVQKAGSAWLSAIRGLGGARAVTAVKYPDLHRPLLETTVTDISSDWLAQMLTRGSVFLNIERRLPLANVVTSASVVDLVVEDQQLVESTGLLGLAELLQAAA
jgi:hypothetical protein